MRRPSTTETVISVLAILALLASVARASTTGGSALWGKGTKKLPPAKDRASAPKLGKRHTPGGAPVVDVDRPKKRATTEAERQRYAKEQRAKRLDATPPGTISASPELEPRHGQTPAGYDAGEARAQAQGIAAHLAAKGPRAYERNRLAQWQTLAGVRADGVYGGSSRGALIYYGIKDPPRPFVAPFATLPYHPPE